MRLRLAKETAAHRWKAMRDSNKSQRMLTHTNGQDILKLRNYASRSHFYKPNYQLIMTNILPIIDRPQCQESGSREILLHMQVKHDQNLLLLTDGSHNDLLQLLD